MAKGFKKPAAELFLSTAEAQQDAPHATVEGFSVPKGYVLAREGKSERAQLLLRPTTKAAIKAEAAERGISMNDLINQILDDYLERQGI